jgi:D-glycero-D-manno-heptose 1,7-bisphosphate phosphatase
MKPAVFFDRDGTLIEDVHYLGDPAKVRLLSGVPESIRTFQSIGFACVVITNQSAVGRGLVTLQAMHDVNAEMHRQLGEHNVRLDGLYYCTTVPANNDRTIIDDPDRKPGPGMLLRAAKELDLDLKDSWMIGDMLSDILAGRNAGCRGSILVRTGRQSADIKHEAIDFTADNILLAAQWVGRQNSFKPVRERGVVQT